MALKFYEFETSIKPVVGAVTIFDNAVKLTLTNKFGRQFEQFFPLENAPQLAKVEFTARLQKVEDQLAGTVSSTLSKQIASIKDVLEAKSPAQKVQEVIDGTTPFAFDPNGFLVAANVTANNITASNVINPMTAALTDTLTKAREDYAAILSALEKLRGAK